MRTFNAWTSGFLACGALGGFVADHPLPSFGLLIASLIFLATSLRSPYDPNR